MNVLVTGSKGFVGKNLVAALKNIKEGKEKVFDITQDIELFECDLETSDQQLDQFCQKSDFVFHLAGVNRTKNDEEFMVGNYGFTTTLLEKLAKYNNKAPILMSSSIQAALQNEYGISKKAGEDYLIQYGQRSGVITYVYRLANVFGKWCKPNYNSVIATFCHNIANDLPITVTNCDTKLNLVYIDDVVDAFINTIKNKVSKNGEFCCIDKVYETTLGHIVDVLEGFKKSRTNFMCPYLVENSFEKKLYSTYLSYIPVTQMQYDLKMNCDERGAFTEFLKTNCYGQVSINKSKPHIVKGNHWHRSKTEKFLVVSGKGVIRLRNIDSEEITEIFVSGDRLQVVDIPTGYTHNIENLGDDDMITVMWANEMFDANNPDTYFLKI